MARATPQLSCRSATDARPTAFDVDAARRHAFAVREGLDATRSYDDYKAMISGELSREDRIDAVAICTPNFTHFPISKAFLEAGFDVICEKPLTAPWKTPSH
jgi:predicted dehydrogenase